MAASLPLWFDAEPFELRVSHRSPLHSLQRRDRRLNALRDGRGVRSRGPFDGTQHPSKQREDQVDNGCSVHWMIPFSSVTNSVALLMAVCKPAVADLTGVQGADVGFAGGADSLQPQYASVA